MTRRAASSVLTSESSVIGSTSGTLVVVRTVGEASRFPGGSYSDRSLPFTLRIVAPNGSDFEDMTVTARPSAPRAGRSFTVTRSASPRSDIAAGAFCYALESGEVIVPESVTLPSEAMLQGATGPAGATGPLGFVLISG